MLLSQRGNICLLETLLRLTQISNYRLIQKFANNSYKILDKSNCLHVIPVDNTCDGFAQHFYLFQIRDNEDLFPPADLSVFKTISRSFC